MSASGAMHGADVGQVRALAAQLNTAAGRLDDIRRLLRARLYSSTWEGGDAAHFMRSWEGQLQPMLLRTAAELRVASQRLATEGHAQEQASAGGSAVAAGSGAGGGLASRAPGLLAGAGLVPMSGLEGLHYDVLAAVWRWGIGTDVVRGVDLGTQATTNLAGVALSGVVSAHAGLRGAWGAHGELGPDGASIGAAASASAGVEAAAAGTATAGIAALGAHGSAFVGAQGRATAGAALGPDGASAHAGVSGLVGASVSAGASAEVGGVTAGVGATAYAGFGAKAEIDAELSTDRIQVDIELGAALGIGGGVDVSLDFSPAEAARDFSSVLGWL